MTAVVVSLVIMLVFLCSGLWIALSIGGAGIICLLPKLNLSNLISLIGLQFFSDNTTFLLVAVPLFIFMGELLFRSGFTGRLYNEVTKIVAGLPGGLLQTNIIGCMLHAACTGSSAASAASMGIIAYENQAPRGYDKGMITGSIAAGGTLGILIPPSIMLIVYGVLSGESIGRLFIAGIIPGIMLSGLFSLYIALRCIAQPTIVPHEYVNVTLADRLKAAFKLWPAMLLVIIVLGSIYSGISTPTEAASLGCAFSFIYLAGSGRLTWLNFKESLLSTVATTSMVLFVVTCAKLFAIALSYYGLPAMLANKLSSSDLSSGAVFFIVVGVFLIVGCFLESLSIVVVITPFLVPIFKQYGFDLVWMGIVVVLLAEVGLITPPVGVNLFVLQGISGEPLERIAKGSVPFFILMIISVIILYFVPDLALFLPRFMRGP